MRRLICKDITCKYHDINNVCKKATVEIARRECQSYERGFHYYVNLVWNKLKHSNMITAMDMSHDMRIGLYYVMKIFNLSFVDCEHGDWRFLMLVKEKGGKGLTYDEIIELPMNTEALIQLNKDYENGILPGADTETKKPKKESQPFGWLSPTGEFFEGDWGEHETVAWDIINKKHLYAEFQENPDCGGIARDFLSEVKGYCLIHNPSGTGGYIVSHVKPLTKKQKEFLYGYFMDLGDTLKAERYLD